VGAVPFCSGGVRADEDINCARSSCACVVLAIAMFRSMRGQRGFRRLVGVFWWPPISACVCLGPLTGIMASWLLATGIRGYAAAGPVVGACLSWWWCAGTTS